MKTWMLLMLGMLVSGTELFAAEFNAGYAMHRLEDTERQRPVLAELWYPTDAPAYPYHYGISNGNVAVGAGVAGDDLPLVLLLPGALGTASNYMWLAEALARRGFAVLGISHIGESPVLDATAVNPVNAGALDERTRDIHVALSLILENPRYAQQLDAAHVSVIGHSSGGTTALLLAGATQSRESMGSYCSSSAAQDDKGCRYPRSATADAVPVPLTTAPAALVLLDPALGPSFTPQTLGTLQLPILLVAATQNDFLPYSAHSAYLAEHLPEAGLIELNQGEGHFVFIGACSLPIDVMGVPLCQDRDGVDRGYTQRKVAEEVAMFLGQLRR